MDMDRYFDGILAAMAGMIVFASIVSLVLYFIAAFARYKYLRIRSYENAWMAFVPIVNIWAIVEATYGKKERINIYGWDAPAVVLKLWPIVVDLAKETAKRLGMKIEFKSIDWSLKLDELNSKHIDIIWSGLDITPERQENILFSKPYMDNRQIVFVRRDGDFKIISEIDLAGKIVGTQAGSTVSDYLDTNENLKNSFRELKTYNTYTNAWNALDYGEIDALICDEIFGRYAMSKELDKFEALNVIVGTASSFGVGFRKTDVELRNKVQKVLNEMIKDGTAKKISERWFQADLIKSHR